jgi:hypothetical protein
MEPKRSCKRAAQTYMLISIHTETSAIIGAFQAIFVLQGYGATAQRSKGTFANDAS